MMSMREMDLIVSNRDIKETEGKSTYILKLKHPDGHYLVLKSDTEDLFAGFPINQLVHLKLTNPQGTLGRP